MTQVNLIAAVGKSGQLGLGGHLPWHEPEDLKWFKEMTQGGVVLVGFKTYATLPMLPGRAVVVDDVEAQPERLMRTLETFQRPIWIGGGANTYKRWMHLCTRSFLSHIDYDGEADVFMPPLWSAES